jgi:hypothetical protein
MWKKEFILRVDAHPGDGMLRVSVTQDADDWVISGLDVKDLRLPNDDNVLAQIIDVCQQIIDHPDNPLNGMHLKCPEQTCYASDFYNVGENRFFCYGCLTQYRYEKDGNYTPISQETSEHPLESAVADVHFSSAGSKPAVSK